MTISLGTIVEGHNDSGSSATTITVTLSATAGDGWLIFASWGDGTGTTTAACADNVDGSYGSQLLGAQLHDAANQQGYTAFWKANKTAGSATVTITFSAACPYRYVAIVTVPGAKTASAITSTTVGQTQLTPTTGAGAVTSGAITVGTQPALVIAAAFNSAGNGGPAAVITGGWTNNGTIAWPPSLVRVMSQRVTATGALTPTFTAGTNTAHMTIAVAIDEDTGGGGGGSPDLNATRRRAQSTAPVLDDVATAPRRKFLFLGQPAAELSAFIGLYQSGEIPPVETFTQVSRRRFPFLGSTTTIASASFGSLGFGLASGFGSTIQPSSAASFGLGAPNASGATLAPGNAYCLGVALPAANAVGIAAGTPGALGLALCGIGPSCVAPAAATAWGLGLGAELGAVVAAGIPGGYGLGLAGANGAAVNGSFVTGTPTGLGLGLAAGSGYGVAVGTPTSLGLGSSSAPAALFALGRPASISLSLAGSPAAGIEAASGASAGGAWVAAQGVVISSAATPGYGASLGLGLLSGSGYGIAAGSPTALRQSIATASAAAYTSARAAALGSSGAAAPGGGIESSNPKTIGLSFAFAGGVAIVPGFANANASGIGYALVSARGSDQPDFIRADFRHRWRVAPDTDDGRRWKA